MSTRTFAIPTAGALGVVLTACGNTVDDADEVLGQWSLAQASLDGELVTYPRHEVETYDGYYGSVTVEINVDRSMELHRQGEGFDVVSRYSYAVIYTIDDEKYAYRGTFLSLGKAWLMGGRDYSIVIPGENLDLTCTGSIDILDCGDGNPDSTDTYRFER